MKSGYILTKGRKIPIERPLVMGILNMTPDSFSDGGLFIHPHKAIDRAMEMIDQGADIIDIGAESSRPFAMPVGIEEEKARIGELICVLANDGVCVSIDTYKPEVAEFALKEGALIVNDITGLRDERMMKIVAESKAAVVIMHMQGNPRTMQLDPQYGDVIDTILEYLKTSTKRALENGIDRRSIIVDPGIGFGKRPDDNFLIIKEMEAFTEPGFPVLLGASRKSFLKAIGFDDVKDRLEGSLAVAAISVFHGASVIRTHDVRETRKIVNTAWAVKYGIGD